MKIGQARIGISKIEAPKPENRSGGSLMKKIKERQKAIRDQHREDQTPPQTLSRQPREDDS